MCMSSSLFNLLAASSLHLSSPSLGHRHHPPHESLIVPFDMSRLVPAINSLPLSIIIIPVSLAHASVMSSSSTVSPLSSSMTPSLFHSSSSSSSGASLTGHSCLHELTPLGTFLRTLPRRIEAEIVLLEVELNRSKPGSSWSTRRALPVHRQTTDSCP